MLWGYAHLAERQHQANPDDTTIPTFAQLKEGAMKCVEKNPRSGDRWLVVDSVATGKRLFLGLAAGILGAFVIGVFMGCFATVQALLAPPLGFFAKVPPTAALAVFFVLVGTDTEMYVAMIAFGILPALAQSIYLSIRDVPDELIYKAYTLGASHMEVVWNVIVRVISPQLIDAIRLQIGPALVYLIAAEMVVGDVGFGYRIRLQSRLLNMNVVYPYLLVLAGVGFVLDHGLRLLQRWMCPWYAGAEK